ncbi:armadillo-type protein [Fimicolochytrium jonesii]|uniref:armadillo-type protein n=1 Tax=Fimicolochytrium jonesii TaxID=1396493 RepID=UPI0022FE10F1|nr:armadillo-type protein [Fimicolochytrium jonesii]KAI8819542.1 armadillo-type protein [Fimicolochytrium jonesii]
MSGRGTISSSELLQWGTAHMTPGSEPPAAPREPIDPKWLEVIMGKEDAARMKDCMEIIQATDKSLDEKEGAFDELEMLVESLDNANDLRPLKLWQPLIDIATTSDEAKLRMYAAWVMGTAVQNNKKAQDDFLAAGGLEHMLLLVSSFPDSSVRDKAFYCVTSAVRNNPQALETFMEKNGIASIVTVGLDGDTRLLKRAMFFIRSLVEDENPAEATRAAQAAKDNGVPDMAADLILADISDMDLVEKCLQLLTAFAKSHPKVITADLRTKLTAQVLPALEAHAKSDTSEEPLWKEYRDELQRSL